MDLLRWLKRAKSDRVDPRVAEWRRAWTVASTNGEAASVESLGSRLGALGLPDEETEIEREMLEGLQALVQLRNASAADGLPIIETGHRVIGADRCHFSSPVSMPEDEAQPSGRLLLTGSRAIFVGGARTKTVPWHAVAEVLQHDRDLVLIRKDRDSHYRFRCNSYADALCGAYLARRLSGRPQPPDQPRIST
jgi:hypothetical protein